MNADDELDDNRYKLIDQDIFQNNQFFKGDGSQKGAYNIKSISDG